MDRAREREWIGVICTSCPCKVNSVILFKEDQNCHVFPWLVVFVGTCRDFGALNTAIKRLSDTRPGLGIAGSVMFQLVSVPAMLATGFRSGAHCAKNSHLRHSC